MFFFVCFFLNNMRQRCKENAFRRGVTFNLSVSFLFKNFSTY